MIRSKSVLIVLLGLTLTQLPAGAEEGGKEISDHPERISCVGRRR